jgi:hypothetical protein
MVTFVGLTLKQLWGNIVPCLDLNPWIRILESDIMDMRYVNLFTPLPLPCSALTEAWKSSCGDHLFGRLRSLHSKNSVWGWWQKFSFGVYSGEAKGSVLAPFVTFVCCWSFHMLLTLILLTWNIRWASNNASKWQMGFNLAFKGLRDRDIFYVLPRSQP